MPPGSAPSPLRPLSRATTGLVLCGTRVRTPLVKPPGSARELGSDPIDATAVPPGAAGAAGPRVLGAEGAAGRPVDGAEGCEGAATPGWLGRATPGCDGRNGCANAKVGPLPPPIDGRPGIDGAGTLGAEIDGEPEPSPAPGAVGALNPASWPGADGDREGEPLPGLLGCETMPAPLLPPIEGDVSARARPLPMLSDGTCGATSPGSDGAPGARETVGAAGREVPGALGFGAAATVVSLGSGDFGWVDAPGSVIVGSGRAGAVFGATATVGPEGALPAEFPVGRDRTMPTPVRGSGAFRVPVAPTTCTTTSPSPNSVPSML